MKILDTGNQRMVIVATLAAVLFEMNARNHTANVAVIHAVHYHQQLETNVVLVMAALQAHFRRLTRSYAVTVTVRVQHLLTTSRRQATSSVMRTLKRPWKRLPRNFPKPLCRELGVEDHFPLVWFIVV
jgi:metal-dependent amidase/aminoacylase/carboxypeptidase family protein